MTAGLVSRHRWRLYISVFMFLFICFSMYSVRYRSVDTVDHFLSSASTSIYRTAPGGPPDQRLAREAAANDTLGFQTIVALTRGTTWGVKGLRTAAAYTGLHIEVSPQPSLSQKEIQEFQHQGSRHSQRPGPLDAVNWMEHLEALRRIAQGPYATALIVEENVDWDINIRDQMKVVSDGVRRLTGTFDSAFQASETGERPATPYGHDWDVLWVGNCGEDVEAAVSAANRGETGSIATWSDPTAISGNKYIGWARNSIKMLPNRARAVLWAKGPVCSYAYGVTRDSASKILQLANSGGALAFDVKLSQICRDKQLRCITVAPELIHAYSPQSPADADVSGKLAAHMGQGPVALAAEESLSRAMGSTNNIVNSARCRALYDQTCLPPA